MRNTLSNLANLIQISLKIFYAMLGELLSVLRRISELRANFLKHSQKSHFTVAFVFYIFLGDQHGFSKFYGCQAPTVNAITQALLIQKEGKKETKAQWSKVLMQGHCN